MFFLELEKENYYLLGNLNQENILNRIAKGITLIKFKFISSEEKPKIDFNSFNIVRYAMIHVCKPLDIKIYCIELKNGNIAPRLLF